MYLVTKRLLTNTVIVDLLNITEEDIKDSLDRRLIFYSLFPDKVDKGRAAEGFKWICDRIKDGKGVSTPRDLLSVLDVAKSNQISQNQRESIILPQSQLFTEDTLRRAIKRVSEENLVTKLYAEYPDLRSIIAKFENGKADHNEDTLLKLLGEDWAKIIPRLERIGFIYQRRRNNIEMWTIPHFYSFALNITRGASFIMEGSNIEEDED